MGTPSIYTEEQIKLRRKAQNRESRERRRARDRLEEQQARKVRGYFVFHAPEDAPVRPPIELLLERDYRVELLGSLSLSAVISGDPPPSYSANYYNHAWRIQRRFARGEID